MNKIKFLILSIILYTPKSYCTFNFTIEDMLKSAITIENQTEIKVSELGMKFDGEVDTHLIGRPDSKQYSKWMDIIRRHCICIFVENKLQESSLKLTRQNNELIIERTFRMICKDKEEALPLLEYQFQELMNLLNQSNLSKGIHIILKGKISIYGIDDPELWLSLPKHLKEQECKKLSYKFGCKVKSL